MTRYEALLDLEKFLTELNATKSGRRAFLAAAPFMLSACAAGTKSRYREGDNTGQETKLTVADEKRMTAEVLPEMRKEYPALQNDRLQTYIKTLGAEIVQDNGLNGNPYNYSFTVVAVPMVNAFALPAGTVFVTAPLIAMADSEAELAGVVGHEIGHIQARHTAERMDRAEREKNKSIFAGVGGGLLGGAAGFGLGKLLCPPKDSACLAKATAAGAVAGAGAGLLIRKFQFMANSREDEMEADRIGFRTSVKAGYDKKHVGRFYSKLLKMEQAHQQNRVPLVSGVQDAMSTHPPSQERVNQMNQMVSESSAPAGKLSSDGFENAKDFSVSWTQKNSAKKG